MSESTPTPQQPKPGWKTSEFLLALAVTAIGAFAAVYSEAPWAQAAGMIAATLASAGYGFSRAAVKKAGDQ